MSAVMWPSLTSISACFQATDLIFTHSNFILIQAGLCFFYTTYLIKEKTHILGTSAQIRAPSLLYSDKKWGKEIRPRPFKVLHAILAGTSHLAITQDISKIALFPINFISLTLGYLWMHVYHLQSLFLINDSYLMGIISVAASF